MNNTRFQLGEVRSPATPDPRPDDYAVPVPLLRLRGHGREPIPPERCLLGDGCLVCRWRREGLLRSPLLSLPPDARAA